MVHSVFSPMSLIYRSKRLFVNQLMVNFYHIAELKQNFTCFAGLFGLPDIEVDSYLRKPKTKVTEARKRKPIKLERIDRNSH